MQDSEKTQNQLLEELSQLRGRVAALEAADRLHRGQDQWASQLLDVMPLGIHECDSQGRITFVNPAQEAVTGYTADELLGTYVWDRTEPPSAKAAAAEQLKTLVLDQPVPTPYFARNVRKNGEVYDVRVDWNYKRDANGQVVGFVSIISDITEQKRLERELRKSQAILRATIDCLPFDFFALGPDGRYILQNAASKECWGDAVGRTAAEVCKDPGELAKWLDNNRRAYAGEKVERETTFLLHGEECTCLAVLAPIQDSEERYGILGINVDLTRRKQAEEALRQSEQRYRMLTESTTDMIFILNRSGEVLYANRSAAAAVRRDAGTVVGRRQDELFSPENVEKHLQSIAWVFKTGEVYKEDGLYRFGSEEIWLNTRLIPLRERFGAVTAVMGVARDITDRKRGEAALKQAHDELEQRVEERTAELTKTNNALRQSHRELEAIYNQIVDGIAIVDAERERIVRANSAFCRMLGLSADEVCHVLPETIHPPGCLPRVREHVETIKREGVARAGDLQFIRADRGIVYADVVSSRIDYDQKPCWISFVHDVTKRKRYEEALAESEAKYRHLVEATGTGYLILDEEGRVLDANDEYVRLTGHQRLADVIGRKVLEWTAPHDVQRNAKAVEECLRSGAIRHFEIDYAGRDGMTIPIEINASVVAGEQGKQIISLCRDITDRRQAEEALRQSEQKYKGLVEASPDAVIITDIQGIILFASHRTLRFLGLSEQEDLAGRSVLDFVIESDRLRLAANIPELMKTGIRRNTEYTVQRQDGTTFPVEISSAAGPNTPQQPWAVLAVVRDISERKQYEETLRQSEEKYRSLVDICPDSIVVSDLTGKTQFVSKQTWKLLGVPEEEELVGQSTYDYVVEADRQRLKANYADLFKKGHRGETEYTTLRRDGATVPVELSSVIRRDAQGRPNGAMAIIRDVSERKRAEQALQKEHRTLKHLLRSSDHERQVIAYEIHDGLAQQLAGAIMQIETYWHQKDARPELAVKAYDAALTMLRQAHFETRRLISGVRPPILDESGIVAAIAHLVNEQSLQHDLKIEFRSDVSFHRLAGILENAAYRIVQEALTNACRHSQSDRVRVEVAERNEALRIKVQDWGIGFNPAAVREDHFGLEGIRERARLLGGAATIESSPQQGAVITVELPLVLRED